MSPPSAFIEDFQIQIFSKLLNIKVVFSSNSVNVPDWGKSLPGTCIIGKSGDPSGY